MFFRDREEVAKTLEELRFDLCCYMSRNFCDCKYGYQQMGDKFHPGYVNHGEQTGCPELRSMVALLSFMTDEEYNTILTRGMNIKL
jgi:hypothetical protein